MVYFAIANKPIKYEFSKSRIVYIGTTKNGSVRIASTASVKAGKLLNNHGFSSLEFHFVTCRPRSGVKTWKKLERALIILFRERYGKTPIFNVQGMGMSWSDELDYFTRTRLETIVTQLSR